MGRRSVRLQRPAAIDGGGERFVVDLHEGGSVLGPVGAVRDRHGDRLAGITDLPVGEDRRVQHMPYRTRGLGQRHRHPRHVRPEVFQGEHRADPRRRLGGGTVDAANPGMRLGAPHESGVQQVGEAQVVDELSPPAQQRRVLDPPDRFSERTGLHGRRGDYGLTQPPST